MNIEIVFLCDQEADCKTSPRCGKECIRTTNIEHAKNFAFVSVNEEKSAYIETGESYFVSSFTGYEHKRRATG